MTVIPLKDLRPPSRDDMRPWTFARIQEAPLEGSSWMQIDRIALVPDSNPALPQIRNLTTENATLDDGLYRVVWEDEDGDLSTPTIPIRSGEGLPAWLPTQVDVASLMFARAMGELNGTPSFSTRPSPAQVEDQIRMAWLLLAPVIGRDVPVEWQPTAREVVKLQTALLLEPGFWPEQQRDAVRAAWDEWEKLLDRYLAGLLAGLRRDRDDGAAGDGEPVALSVPLWSFPPAREEYIAGAELPRRYGW